MSNTRELRERNYKVKPFGSLVMADETYLDIWGDYQDGNSMGTTEEEMEEIIERVCAFEEIPTKKRIAGVRLREEEEEDGISLNLWIYSIQDTKRGREILDVEKRRAYAPGLGVNEFDVEAEGDEDSMFLIGADHVAYGAPAFGGRLAIYAKDKGDLDISCEIGLAISWEDAEDLIRRIFEIEEV